MMTLLLSFFILITLFTAGWIIAGKIRNVSIVDAMWALSLSIPVIFYVRVFEGNALRDFILLSMALTWSLRLGIHLLRRIHKEHPTEDKRYQNIRNLWGEKAHKKFLIIFIINALLVFLLSLPFYFSAQSASSMLSLEWIGLAVFIIGLTGETIADRQLKRYRKSSTEANYHKVCKVGLWNYSRHPNYFFESVIWLGIYLFCAASPGGYYMLHAPLLITFLLVKVTGIPPLERMLLESRGDVYRKYQQSTSAFIPWFKK